MSGTLTANFQNLANTPDTYWGYKDELAYALEHDLTMEQAVDLHEEHFRLRVADGNNEPPPLFTHAFAHQILLMSLSMAPRTPSIIDKTKRHS